VRLFVYRADKLINRSIPKLPWFVFNEDHRLVVKAERLLGADNRLHLYMEVKAHLEKAKTEYAERLLPLHRKYHQQPEWLLSPVPGKVDWPPDYIVNRAIIEALKVQLSRESRDMVILTTNLHLVSLLKELPGTDVDIRDAFWPINLKKEFRFWGECLYQVYQALKSKIVTRRLPVAQPQQQFDVLIRTYVQESSFEPSGRFKDPYFRDLAQDLEVQGCQVWIEPNLSAVKNPGDLVSWVRSFDHRRFFIRERHISLSDVLKTLAIAFKSRLLLQRIHPAFRQALRSYHGSQIVQGWLKSLTPEYLSRLGLRPKCVLFLWENTPYEKVWIKNARERMSSVRLDGYTPAIQFDTHPVLTVTPEEYRFTPLPDRIICSSSYFRDWLLQAGLPKDRLILGPNLRQEIIADLDVGRPTRDMLFLFSIQTGMAVEAMNLILPLARSYPDRNFFLKLHPAVKLTEVLSLAGETQLPPNIQILEGALEKAFERCSRVVVIGPTTVILEALCYGCRTAEFISKNIPNGSLFRPHFSLGVAPVSEYQDLERFLFDKRPLSGPACDPTYMFNSGWMTSPQEKARLFCEENSNHA